MTANVLRRTIRAGESMFEAICDAGAQANREGYEGYVICCEKCGDPVHEHESPDDCKSNRRRNLELRALAAVKPNAESRIR